MPKRLSRANSRWVDGLWRADVSEFNSVDTQQPGSMRRGLGNSRPRRHCSPSLGPRRSWPRSSRRRRWTPTSSIPPLVQQSQTTGADRRRPAGPSRATPCDACGVTPRSSLTNTKSPRANPAVHELVRRPLWIRLCGPRDSPARLLATMKKWPSGRTPCFHYNATGSRHLRG
jgi:hypothetical protein